MIEFLMLHMKEYMSKEDHDDFIKKWREMSSSTETMQIWVDNVRTFIGSEKYEGIKARFIREEKDKKEQESSMNCTLPFVRYRSSVKFKKDIGADAKIDGNLASFKEEFENILHGIQL